MNGKRIYRTVDVEQISIPSLVESLPAGGCIVAVDVAKEDFVVGIAGPDGRVVRHVRFSHPRQTGLFLGHLEELRRSGCEPVVVLEPTGTYGDSLRSQLVLRGISVFSISPKRCHDAAELFDGVPSQHDAKSTAILARLHAQGLSRVWNIEPESKRESRAVVERRELYQAALNAHHGRLEALLARHWPELGSFLDIRRRVSVLLLLETFPSPADVASHRDEVTALLCKTCRGQFTRDRVSGLIDSAARSLGMPLLPAERALIQALATEMLRLRRMARLAERDIAKLVEQNHAMMNVARVVGRSTAAVLVSHLGEPAQYSSAAAFEKACGLNLKERSSGSHKGRLAITKRGPGRVRHYLFLATLRLIQTDHVARAWYATRSSFGPNCRLKAVIALMRKFVRALWHVGRGAVFDSTKLFDTRRLRDIPRTALTRSERIEIGAAM